MAKRRIKTPTFQDAFGQIDKMEQAVCYRSVTRGYELEDVCDYLWPAEVVRKLRDAFPLTPASSHGMYSEYSAQINDVTCVLNLTVHVCNMCTPVHGLIVPQGPDNVIMQDLRLLRDIHTRFNGLREVVTWLNDYATPAAARYYFPSLGALLPSGHGFHSADGLRAAGCRGNIAEIAGQMRDASATIATGLLCEPDKVVNSGRQFTVQVAPAPLTHPNRVWSNDFPIL